MPARVPNLSTVPDLVRWSHILEHLASGTRRALGALGFTDNVAWTGPERVLSCAMLAGGTPIPDPEVVRWIGLPDGITSETPKVADTDLAF
ncbi:hypothetical protein OH799_28060 [Nocardia sp. NBC_00881]|uniref:hypothetical protein n=1 Tax=Nocardia sp. NBC_00881 TaxID=2975995 RepID=UPI00386BDD5F|nr:hypothetical protein OH799_28060 [Nocardia sp. NBC_00881]